MSAFVPHHFCFLQLSQHKVEHGLFYLIEMTLRDTERLSVCSYKGESVFNSELRKLKNAKMVADGADQTESVT